MKSTGRRAWRRAAKRMRRMHGRRWRSAEAIWGGKRWSELVPDLDAHRVQITGAWFRRHRFSGDDESPRSRHYVGLFGSVDGDHVVMQFGPRPLTPRALVGMTERAKKRAAWAEYQHAILAQDGEEIGSWDDARAKYRIGKLVRLCPGCCSCQPCGGTDRRMCIVRCDGSGAVVVKKPATARSGSR